MAPLIYDRCFNLNMASQTGNNDILYRGVPRIWEVGGGARTFFQKPCALLWGRGRVPRENFFKTVQFGAF